MRAPLPPDEEERLKALRGYDIMDTGPEREFDDITLLASQICGTPIALITLLDENRQWFKSKIGITITETSRDIAFCAHGIMQPGVFVVNDARTDERFAANPLVTDDPGIRFYAGAPLIAPDGHALGMLCVNDRVPRELSGEQKLALEALSRQAVAQLELRRGLATLRRTEESLRLLNSAVLQCKESIMITDANLDLPGPKILFVNPAFTRMTGFTAEEAIGKNPRMTQGPRTDRAVLRSLREKLERGEGFEGETINYRKDGTEFELEWQIAPIRDAGGEVTHFVAIQRDIGARKESERARERLLAIVESTTDMISMITPDGGILYLNRAGRILMGEGLEDDITKYSLTDRIPDYRNSALCTVSIPAAIRDGVWSGETVAVNHFTGKAIRFSQVVLAHKGADGKVGYLSTSMRDITERKLAEDALRESEEKFHQLADNISDVFWITSPDLGKIHYVSAAYERIWGRSLESLYADPHQRIEAIVPEGREAALAAFAALMEIDSEVSVEYQITRPDGTTRWIHDRGYQVRDAAGTLVRLTGIAADITERKRLEAHLFQSQKMETVGKLAGGIAHEFNSILTAIIGQSELMLCDLPPGSPLARNATEITTAANRAAKLTRQILAYGRKQILQPEALDLNRVLANMDGMLHQLMGGEVDTRIVQGPNLLWVKADCGQIEQVIMNIAINARDAMPNGGLLTLETESVTVDMESVGRYPELAPGEYVLLAITDTGAGMTPEVKARVFEPFFSTKAIGMGTGMGLSTCHGIIKQSGGHISVYSEPSRGTTFKIYLPRLKEEAKAPVRRLDSPDLPRGTETILLVEDDPALREMAATLLRRLGYTVQVAADGIEALSLKQRADIGHIDLLFTDVVMPHMSGKELSERMQALFPHTKTLFTSAYTGNAIIHQGVLDEGVVLLQKPFTPSSLAHRLREMLDQPKGGGHTP